MAAPAPFRVKPTPQAPTFNLEDPKAVAITLRGIIQDYVLLANRLNAVLAMNGSDRMTNPLPLFRTDTAHRPPAADWPGAIMYDTTLNEVIKSNGTTWSIVP